MEKTKKTKINKKNNLKVIVRNPVTKEQARLMILKLCEDLST